MEKYKQEFEHYSYICECTGLNNRCTFGLSNRLDGRFTPATELELNRFRPLAFGELVCHLSTQVNNGLLAAYITVFDLRRGNRRCFIQSLVYDLVYPGSASNLVKLATLSPRYDYVCTHTCSPFLMTY